MKAENAASTILPTKSAHPAGGNPLLTHSSGGIPTVLTLGVIFSCTSHAVFVNGTEHCTRIVGWWRASKSLASLVAGARKRSLLYRLEVLYTVVHEVVRYDIVSDTCRAKAYCEVSTLSSELRLAGSYWRGASELTAKWDFFQYISRARHACTVCIVLFCYLLYLYCTVLYGACCQDQAW